MVIKCKPRVRVELEKVSEQAYQTNDPSLSRVIVDTDIPANLCSIVGKIDIIEFPKQHSIHQADEDEDEKEEFDDNVEIKSDEDSPQLSE